MGVIRLTGRCELTLLVTLVVETGLESNRCTVDQSYIVAAGIDVLADKTNLGISLHLRQVGTTTKDVRDAHDDCILRHCYFTSLSLFVYGKYSLRSFGYQELFLAVVNFLILGTLPSGLRLGSNKGQAQACFKEHSEHPRSR